MFRPRYEAGRRIIDVGHTIDLFMFKVGLADFTNNQKKLRVVSSGRSERKSSRIVA